MFVSLEGNIHAGTTVTLETSPSLPVKLDRLLVPPSIGPYFKINSIVVCRTECELDGAPIHAELFVWRNCTACGAEETVGGTELQFPEFAIQPGMLLRISVTNTSLKERTFSCSFEGATDMSTFGRPYRRKPVLAVAQLLVAAYRARDLLSSKEASWAGHRARSDTTAPRSARTHRGLRNDVRQDRRVVLRALPNDRRSAETLWRRDDGAVRG